MLVRASDLYASDRHPVVAVGVLRWISVSVSEKDFFATNFTTGQVPLQLALLDRACLVVICHSVCLACNTHTLTLAPAVLVV